MLFRAIRYHNAKKWSAPGGDRFTGLAETDWGQLAGGRRSDCDEHGENFIIRNYTSGP